LYLASTSPNEAQQRYTCQHKETITNPDRAIKGFERDLKARPEVYMDGSGLIDGQQKQEFDRHEKENNQKKKSLVVPDLK
jgi:hypothetical protein